MTDIANIRDHWDAETLIRHGEALARIERDLHDARNERTAMQTSLAHLERDVTRILVILEGQA